MRSESDRDRVVRLGRQALKNLDKDKNWTWWIDVGNAILIGREECKTECGITPNTNLPPGSWGANYNRAFGEWLVREKLDFDKGDRSRLFEVMDNLAAIEGWRMTLTLSERLRLNHPSTVLRKWKAATQPPPRTGERTPTLRDSVVGLSEENAAKDIEIAALRAGPAELEAAREQAPPAETPPATLLAASDHVMHLAAEDTAWPASGHALDGIESWLIYSDAHSVTKWLAHLLLERDDWGALLEAVRKSCEEESDQ